MEPKRIKLEIPTSTSKNATSTYDPRRIIEALKFFRTEPSKTHAELLRLKKHLDSKERVIAFLEYDNKSAYRSMLSHLIGMANDIFVTQNEPLDASRLNSSQNFVPQIASVLRETFSVVANICHLSVLACIETSNFDSLCRVFIRVLEPKKQAKEQLLSTLRGPALRLIGNLCELKETATYVAISAHLMDLVAMSVSRPSDGGIGDDEATDVSLTPIAERRQEEELALRVLRLLATRRKHLRYIVRCNGIARIATFIVRRHRSGESIFTGRPDLIQLLTYVLRLYPTQVGDQLTTSGECVELFLQFLLEHPKYQQQNAKLAHYLTEVILRCVHSSHKMRYQIGQDAISEILRCDQNTLSDVHCRFLCCFLKDVHGRAWLRESGGLDRILCRLATPEQCDNRIDLLRLQQIIMDDLKSILHDNALSLTIHHPNFLPIAIAQINRFLEENSVECETLITHQNELPFHLDSMQEETNNKQSQSDANRQRNSNDEPLCKDFSTSISPWLLHSPAASPPLIRPQVAWSPSMSPSTSSPNHEPQFSSSPSASPSSDHAWLDNYLEEGFKSKAMSPPLQEKNMAPEELETDDPSSFLERTIIDEEDESDTEQTELLTGTSAGVAGGGEHSSSTDVAKAIERKKINKIRAKIVDAFLTLITTFSHLDERQSIVLINENVMRVLVRHVSEAPGMDNRLCRALRRLARHRMGLQKMLEIDFYQMVIRHLIRRQCTGLLNRFAPVCIRCDFRRDFGRRLLGDHALLADSSMGEHFLLRIRLEGAAGTEWERMRTLAAALVLFRKDERRNRFHHNFQPIDVLREFIARLVKEAAITKRNLDEHSAEGRLCCDILSALSALLKRHRDYFEETGGSDIDWLKANPNDSKSSPETVGQFGCVLQSINIENSDQLTLKFLDKNGTLVAEVPKHELCSYNDYFMGMFGSEFLERLTGRDQFVFDADSECCSQEEFVKFLHFSIGCGLQSECVQVSTAECCVAMLRLADKYLCIRLLDHLLQSGKASRFVTGHTLRLFLPLVLSVPTVGEVGGLTNICVLVLLRYCTDAQLLDILRLLAERDTGGCLGSVVATSSSATVPFASALSLVDSLCEALRTFVRPFTELTPQRMCRRDPMRESSLDTSAYWDFS